MQNYAWELRISDVKALQAGLLQNPELSVEAENFLGSGEFRNFDQTETTVSLSQLFEMGGKRAKRKVLATTERDLALWDYEKKRMDIIYQVSSRYIELIASQAEVKLAAKTRSIAEDIYKNIVARVKEGMVSPLEQSKSRVELAKARLGEVRAISEVVSKKQNLSAVWGSLTPLFKQAKGDLFSVQALPELSILISQLDHNPDLARWSTEIERYQKAITLAKAQKIPNITFTAGGRHFAGDDDFAVVAGVSAPLFIFDNKQTTVDETEMMLTQAMQKQRADRVSIQTLLIETYQQLQMSLVGIKVIREEVLPSAREVLNAAKIAYQLGEISSLELLDAQRMLSQSSREHLEVLTVYQLNVRKIERLIGGALTGKVK